MNNLPQQQITEQKAIISELAQLVMHRCEVLSKLSQSTSYLDRRYLSKEHKQANEQVATWMQAANMQTWQDSVGNIWGRYVSPNKNAKRFIMGSHLDTVINGGKYDGMLGVLAPIAIAQILHQRSQTLPFHFDVVGFCDEEGTRFGTTLLGSRALIGKWQDDWADLTDKDNISLQQAMLEFGLDFNEVSKSQLDPSSLVAYLELHIEQGPVLEQKHLATGIVSAIAGAKRLQLELNGLAGHAGTVPMNMRQDTLAGASEMILAIEKIARDSGLVATVGTIENHPNAVNVIPGKTIFSLDIRSENDALRDDKLETILSSCKQIADKRSLKLNWQIKHSAPAVLCDARLIKMLSDASKHANIEPLQLLSGAGHDAMAMAEICPMAMLFTRCDKGISHHPDESIHLNDIEASLDVILNFITSLENSSIFKERNP